MVDLCIRALWKFTLPMPMHGLENQINSSWLNRPLWCTLPLRYLTWLKEDSLHMGRLTWPNPFPLTSLRTSKNDTFSRLWRAVWRGTSDIWICTPPEIRRSAADDRKYCHRCRPAKIVRMRFHFRIVESDTSYLHYSTISGCKKHLEKKWLHNFCLVRKICLQNLVLQKLKAEEFYEKN